jgi:hypothetical protein
MWEGNAEVHYQEWENIPEWERDDYRMMAAAAIKAMIMGSA